MKSEINYFLRLHKIFILSIYFPSPNSVFKLELHFILHDPQIHLIAHSPKALAHVKSRINFYTFFDTSQFR